MALLSKPATWGALILTYFGLIGVFLVDRRDSASKADIAQVCKVVRDVHTNAVFRWHTEQNRVKQTRSYLDDPASRSESPQLYARVQAGFPAQLETLKAAKQGARATHVPPTCQD